MATQGAGKTYGISFTGKNPERGAKEGKETKPKLGPSDGLNCLGLAAAVKALGSEGQQVRWEGLPRDRRVSRTAFACPDFM
jgi:hypothetical protein